jgi:hypothetical protein
MYSMKSSTLNFANDAVNRIRCCPFCAGSAYEIWFDLKPVRYGVQCRSCHATIPATHLTSKEAITTWNRRSGLAKIGGEATAGIRSEKKLRACRANLEKAREVRLLNRLRLKCEIARAILRPYREKELVEAEAALAKTQAEIVGLEPRIRKYEDASRLLDWIRARPAWGEGADPKPDHDRQGDNEDPLSVEHDESAED